MLLTQRLMKLTLSLLLMMVLVNAAAWQQLAPGLGYLRYNAPFGNGSVSAFRIDLQDYRLAATVNKPPLTLSQQLVVNHAVLAINGGFFNRDGEPLGLRISAGKTLSSYRPISWWPIFTVKQQHAAIISANQFNPKQHYDFAVQAGPRLLSNGALLSFKQGLANRSALCIDRQGRVIVAVSNHYALSLQAWASLLKQQFACYNALNLDGGHSSQLAAKIDNFSLSIPSMAVVADVILLQPRQVFK